MISIIDTGGANLTSLQNAFDRLGVISKVTCDVNILDQSTHLILPGVGHAKVAMEKLKQKKLIKYIQETKKPVLGICLGMQLLFSNLEEGGVEGLKILPGTVAKLKPQKNFPVPHMGWSNLEINSTSPCLLDGISSIDSFYFVHSFATPMNNYVTSYVQPFVDSNEKKPNTSNINNNTNPDLKNFEYKNLSEPQNLIPATLQFKNFFGAQFHPEKSGSVGEKLLKNFLKC